MLSPRTRPDSTAQKRIPFAVHQTKGQLTLIEPLDYETEQRFSFFVRVYKRSESRRLTWPVYCMVKVTVNVLDANDNVPRFTQPLYVLSIKENSAKGSLVHSDQPIQAGDLDSSVNRVISYSLTTDSELFQINERSGLLSLISSKLDRETTGDWVNLTIKALFIFVISS